MQIGSIPALLIMQCVDVHLLSPTLAISPCSLYFLDSYQSPPSNLSLSLSLTHFKENPYPSKSAILLGAYGWSAVASFPLCCSLPPLCPTLCTATCGWRTDCLSKLNAWHGCMGWGWGCIRSASWTIIHLQFLAAICILGERVRETRTEGTCGTRMPV